MILWTIVLPESILLVLETNVVFAAKEMLALIDGVYGKPIERLENEQVAPLQVNPL